MVRVWDPAVRVMHWGLAMAVALAWFSGEETLNRHEWAGYAALLVVALRTVWGFIGTPYARFSQFVRRPGAVRDYTDAIRRDTEARHLGHNPLGGWMIVVLLATVAGVGITGWMYTLDVFWGLAWLEWMHRVLAWTLVGLVTLHVAGVVFSSVRHRENLVAAMLTGRKRGE
jgi:cytochrome b